jgi:tetratricopeptide (TPR) repeat protein
VVFAALVVLFFATRGLTAFYQDERQARRRLHLEEATGLSSAGSWPAAAAEFRDALRYGRDDAESRLGLAQALFHLGLLSESRNHLIDLVARDPTSAVVNHLLAQVEARQGRIEEAVSHYRTAIYGRWPADPERNRVATRFELVRLLEMEGRPLQVLGELAELLEDAPDDGVRLRVARHLLAADAPERAATLFEELTHSHPRDAAIFSGLGDAEFARAHYLSARTAFARSLALDPKDASVLERLRLCNRIVELDPTFRRVGTRERYRRSEALATRALAELRRCETGLERYSDQIALAEKLDGSLPRGGAEDSAEENIALAESLLAARVALCPDLPPRDEPLRLVLEKLAQ